MQVNVAEARKCLRDFNLQTLFREHLGWDNCRTRVDVTVGDYSITLVGVAQKRGFTAFSCSSIPDRAMRLKIDHQVARSSREHLIIYSDQDKGQQIWQWIRREPGLPMASRELRFDINQSGDLLIQRLEQIAVSLEEEENITVVDVVGRARAAFDVDKVTKRFYDRFKTEHTAFLNLVHGIESDPDLQWYTSLMLNRLMFVYFIQKKGFLDGDTDYLKNRLAMVQREGGKDKFHTFYRFFLLRLFHDGLGKSPEQRNLEPALQNLLGRVPFLNGGFFEVHQLEDKYSGIDIPDKAFEKLFDFFDQYSWHLDERPLRADNEINPDVVGYIFEKYINQKQMGAYYTKEDITEYIGKNTIIPFLFGAAEKECAVAFGPDSALWRLLRDNPDRYIYPAVQHGVILQNGEVFPESELPDFVQTGMHDPKARMHDNRYNLQQAAADDPVRLVTETWREYISRRNRCLEIREKLQKGEVHQIDDLITLNLDIWQFARDAIVNAEGPELLRAFWHSINWVTVLDPTCGSGAFLFAALRILETLYSDCLERMERFLEEISDKPHHPKQFSDFRAVLDQIAKHPNDRYFILKSIIINNLFGVDIMEEAVEICKLRLFLKLVAQVETPEQIEPLPDIDFNIRAGNTLVGYATSDKVRKAFTEESSPGGLSQNKLMLGDSEEEYRKFEESLGEVERLFRVFRDQQTTHGGVVTHEDKAEILDRLSNLSLELDCFLAKEYGVDVEKQENFKAWQLSHQPFHWFVEFYRIMESGGFDVIIGNPPYVEYSKVKKDYLIFNYNTESCGNLYAFVIERCFETLRINGRIGMIVQLPIVCTDRMGPLQKGCINQSSSIWFANFDDRPSRLFEGLEHIRATVFTCQKVEGLNRTVYSTDYNRWYSEFRSVLFDSLNFQEIRNCLMDGSIPKIGKSTAQKIREHLDSFDSVKNYLTRSDQGVSVYFHNAPQYWIRAMDFTPFFWNERNGEQISSQVKRLLLKDESDATVIVATLNSSLFYWWFLIHSDCRHLNLREIDNFPLGLELMDETVKSRLVGLVHNLMAGYQGNKLRKECQYKTTGKVVYDEFFPKFSKHIIDEIDRELALHYCFTEKELDFIINYDIKYRMGNNDFGEEDG
ncbi:MAG TPA: hypothetical protein PLK59_09605 [Synergistales bacterium]|nr:hypothetical protein [Synergistales bacterium]